MQIFFLAIGAKDRASSRLRVWDHLEWFAARGGTVWSDSLTPPASEATKLRIAARLVQRLPGWIHRFFASDAVVVQEVLMLWPLLIFRHVGKRRRVIFDFSDPVDRHGARFKGVLRRLAFRQMVRRADVTIVENKGYLTSLARSSGGLHHFYGPVDAARYAAAARQAEFSSASAGRLRIGWTGSPGTFRFIAPLLPIIDDLARERPIEVALMGVAKVDHIFRHAKLTLVPWHEATEFSFVPSLDLGLFRLEPTPDAQWRGAGKLFIYMAAGVPFVASDSGIAHGVMAEAKVGFPVADDALWPEVLRRAVEDQEGRSRMGRRSQAYARDAMSYEVYRSALYAHLEGGSERC